MDNASSIGVGDDDAVELLRPWLGGGRQRAPYASSREQFPGCLARLAASRRHRFAGALEGAVNDLHANTTALVQRLLKVDTTQRTAIHGDLPNAALVTRPLPPEAPIPLAETHAERAGDR